VSFTGKARRSLAVALYAAFLGLLLASYAAPIKEIIESKSEVSALKQRLQEQKAYNADVRREIEELQTTRGIERVAREKYGMIKPGEEVYIVPE
jgi:cell division protein FtsB